MSELVRSPSRLLRPATIPDRLAFILRQWQEGAEPDTQAVLEQHPEWEADKPFVQDLVLEEFCLRLERGEDVSIDEFTARFPLYRTSLRRMLAAQRFLDANNELLVETTPTRWPEVGETVGDLTLISELGRGAFARVFLATEASTGNRRVVAKLSFDGQHEALTLGPLEHPNIVRILSAGLDKATGLSVVRMPYHGRATLEDLIDKAFPGEQKTPPQSTRIILDVARLDDKENLEASPSETYEDGVLQIVRQLAEALSFLHARDVCHRDIKPTNVLLSPGGQALLLDFNLSADGGLPPGRLGGTLPYMAPEQLQSMSTSDKSGLGSAADMFALGVIAHELLTGKHPFGPVPVAAPLKEMSDLLIMRHLQGPPSIRSSNRKVGRAIATTLARCLASNPAIRPTAQELTQAIDRHFSKVRRWGRSIARHPLVATMAASAAVAAMVFAGLGIVELTRKIPAAPAPLPGNAQSEAAKLFERGREAMLRNELDMAYDAFRESNSKLPDGKTLACMAYLDSKKARHMQAIEVAEKAITRGQEKNARVFNNRGFSRMKTFNDADNAKFAKEAMSTYDEALADFKKAIELDPTLQAPRYNRANLVLRRALKSPDLMTDEAIEDMRKALTLGPITRKLATDAARLFVLGMNRRPELRTEVFASLTHAVKKGYSTDTLKREPLFQKLSKEEAFGKILALKADPIPTSQELELLDPLPDPESVVKR